MLREQLEQAGLANEALSQDIRRLTADWTKAREELEQKESDWRREEEVYSFVSYYELCTGQFMINVNFTANINSNNLHNTFIMFEINGSVPLSTDNVCNMVLTFTILLK